MILKRRFKHRATRFVADVLRHTPIVHATLLLFVLWLVFSTGVYLAERRVPGTSVDSLGAALYWGIAAFSTAGIADAPLSGPGRLLGGIWIIIGSVIFFGAIIAIVTAYFMRPLQRPARTIVNTIEDNLENLDDLTYEELELLRTTTDGLIEHVEALRKETDQDEAVPPGNG